jgi:vacuolar iron transporter family protein
LSSTRDAQGGLEHAYRAEHEAALLYSALARLEADPTRSEVLSLIADEESAHAAHWARELEQSGHSVPVQGLDARARLLVWLAKHFGMAAIAPLLLAHEGTEAARYHSVLVHPEMRLEERRHGQLVQALGRGDPDPLTVDPWSDADGFNLRAAVFGVNDGLVSNLSLTAGLAGAGVDAHMVILGGTAGLLAGALSMAGGEYLSVRSQQELLQRRLERRQIELNQAPEHAARLLSTTYQARGLAAEESDRVAAAVLSGRTSSSSSELAGLGSPSVAAISSFTAFAVGAIVPLLPYLLYSGRGLLLSILVSGLALACVGAALGLLSGRSLLFSSARMLGIGGTAAAATYFAGRLFNVTL